MKFFKSTDFWIGAVVGIAIYYAYTYWMESKETDTTTKPK